MTHRQEIQGVSAPPQKPNEDGDMMRNGEEIAAVRRRRKVASSEVLKVSAEQNLGLGPGGA